nr:hypothetical protein [Candidatus Desulfacyla euxinica]
HKVEPPIVDRQKRDFLSSIESLAKVQDLIEQAVPGMISLAPTLKHSGFEEEEEWRLIVGPLEHDSDRIRYRTSDHYVVPFVEIDYQNVGLPLEHIIVGPGPHQERSAGSLRQMIDRMGFEGVVIDPSKIPFRSW